MPLIPPPTHSFENDLKQLLHALLIVARVLATPVATVVNRLGTPGPQTLHGGYLALAILCMYVVASLIDGPLTRFPYAFWATLVVLFLWIMHRAWHRERVVHGYTCYADFMGRSWLPGPPLVIKCAVEPLLLIALALGLAWFSLGLCIFWFAAAVSHGLIQCAALFEPESDDSEQPSA